MNTKMRKILSSLIMACMILSCMCFNVSAEETETEILKKSSIYAIRGNYIYDVSVETTHEKFQSNFNSTLSVYDEKGVLLTDGDIVSTGCYFTENGQNYIVVVTGDVDGSGIIDSTDYVLVKNIFLGNSDLSDAAIKASDIDANEKIDTSDYINIKSSFYGTVSLQSSEDYSQKKSIAASLFDSMNALSLLKDYDADIAISLDAGESSIDIDGSFLANNIGLSSPDFAFILNATSEGISYPLEEIYYGNGTLYTKNNGVKYKVDASYAEVSKFLSQYISTSPVNSDGEFILIPSVDSDKILDEDFREIYSVLDYITIGYSNNTLNYTFQTFDIASTSYFKESMNNSIGSDSYGSMKISDIIDTMCVSGTILVDTSGIMHSSDITLDITLTEEGMMSFGAEYPQNIKANIAIDFKNIGGTIDITYPDPSEYITISNIYTQFAFVAYNNVFDIAPALSSTYSETFTMGSKSASTNTHANGKNTESGIVFNKQSDITINGSDSYENVYIGNGNYITDTNGDKSTVSVDTEYLTISKMGTFFTPHYSSVSDITQIIPGDFIENSESYTLNYELTKDYAISLLNNSDVIKLSSFESDFGMYGTDSIELKSSDANITYSKISHELIANTVSFTLLLDGATTVTYSYSFQVDSVEYNNVDVDNSLLN